MEQSSIGRPLDIRLLNGVSSIRKISTQNEGFLQISGTTGKGNLFYDRLARPKEDFRPFGHRYSPTQPKPYPQGRKEDPTRLNTAGNTILWTMETR